MLIDIAPTLTTFESMDQDFVSHLPDMRNSCRWLMKVDPPNRLLDSKPAISEQERNPPLRLD